MDQEYLSYAIGPEGKLVHIDDVPNGKACGCFCPNCGERLQAKQGVKRKHHFSHLSGTECGAAYESMLHLLAKEKVQETFYKNEQFYIEFDYTSFCPNTDCVFRPTKQTCSETRREKFDIKQWYDSCEQEKAYDNITRRSDLKFFSKSHPEIKPIYIEFCVTHASDAVKLHSGNRIIETLIESEEDVLALACDGFIEKSITIGPDWDEKLKHVTAFYGFKTEDTRNEKLWKSCKLLLPKKSIYWKNGYLAKEEKNCLSKNKSQFASSEGRLLVIDNHGKVVNLRTLSYKNLNQFDEFRCVCCGEVLEIREDGVENITLLHKDGKIRCCNTRKYLREAAKKLVLCHFFDERRSFYISPFGYPVDLRKLGYTECKSSFENLKEYSIKYDFALTRMGKIGDDTIYIHFSNDDEKVKVDANDAKVIDIPIKSEQQLLENLMFNDQLNREDIKYHGFLKKGNYKPHGILVFTLNKDGSFEYGRHEENYKPSRDAIYEIQYLADFSRDREAKEFAVLKCLKSGKKVLPCLVCNHLERHEHDADICKLGYSPSVSCDKFLLFKFIDTCISSKYGKAKVKEMEYNSPKEGTLWEMV